MKNLPEHLVIPPNPSPAEMEDLQRKFDGLQKKVLRACDNIVFGNPRSEQKYAKALGGRDQVEIYDQMKFQIPGLKRKTSSQLGIRTRLNG